MKIIGEIIKVETKKTVSMDREHKVVFITDDPNVLQLVRFINEKTVTIEIKDDV